MRRISDDELDGCARAIVLGVIVLILLALVVVIGGIWAFFHVQVVIV